MNAAARVPRPSSAREPPTSWMTAAYQPGQVPAAMVPPLPDGAAEDAEERGGAVAGEEQADDDAEQAEGVRLGAVEASGHVGGLLRSAGPGKGRSWGRNRVEAPTLGAPNQYLQVQHLAMASLLLRGSCFARRRT